MKKVLFTLAIAGFAASVFAQGTIAYYNSGGGLKAPVYGPEAAGSSVSKTGNTTAGTPTGTQVYGGAALNGSAYLAQFFGANNLNQSESSLTAATTVNAFRSGGAAGILVTTTATINSIAPDAPNGATLQLRAWDNTSGLYSTWAQAEVAWNAGLIAAGKSAIFNQSTGFAAGGSDADRNAEDALLLRRWEPARSRWSN